jgi:hypothetical protein
MIVSTTLTTVLVLIVSGISVCSFTVAIMLIIARF